MKTKYLVRDGKGLFLRQVPGSDQNIESWALMQEMAVTFETLAEATAALEKLIGNTSSYKIEALMCPTLDDMVQDFSFKWRHTPEITVERIVENLTEKEMIDRIFEEVKDSKFRLIDAEVRVARKLPKISVEKSL